MKGMMFLENFLQGSSGLYTLDGIYGNHVAAFLKIALPLLVINAQVVTYD
jgi:hypothetical protein